MQFVQHHVPVLHIFQQFFVDIINRFVRHKVFPAITFLSTLKKKFRYFFSGHNKSSSATLILATLYAKYGIWFPENFTWIQSRPSKTTLLISGYILGSMKFLFSDSLPAKTLLSQPVPQQFHRVWLQNKVPRADVCSKLHK